MHWGTREKVSAQWWWEASFSLQRMTTVLEGPPPGSGGRSPMWWGSNGMEGSGITVLEIVTGEGR